MGIDMNKLIDIFRQMFPAKTEPVTSALQLEVESKAAALMYVDKDLHMIKDEALKQRLVADGWYYAEVYYGLTDGRFRISVPETLEQYEQSIENLKKAFNYEPGSVKSFATGGILPHGTITPIYEMLIERSGEVFIPIDAWEKLRKRKRERK